MVGSQVALKPYPSIFHEILAALRIIETEEGENFQKSKHTNKNDVVFSLLETIKMNNFHKYLRYKLTMDQTVRTLNENYSSFFSS